MFNRYVEMTEESIDSLYANIVVKNINFALISLDYILNHPKINADIYHDEYTFYFFHIQSLLTACGNITNVFYNHNKYNNKAITGRCERLREKLGICNMEFPLIFQKEVRNTNEHFDERYRQFKNKAGDYNLLDRNTPPKVREVILSSPHLRTYDKERGVYITYNSKLEQIEYDLHKLQRELHCMLDRITHTDVYNAAWGTALPNETVE